MKADYPSGEAFARAAEQLGVEEAAIRAVAQVESGPFGAFYDDGHPVVLFEPHRFHQYTGGRYGGRSVRIDGRRYDLSYPRWRPGTYGPSRIQPKKLEAAAELDREAALEATSWGLFQILGANWRILGYDSLQAFINAMYRSADDHLDAFVRFIEANRLADELQRKDWRAFARIYNGPAFAKHGYAERMAEAYEVPYT